MRPSKELRSNASRIQEIVKTKPKSELKPEPPVQVYSFPCFEHNQEVKLVCFDNSCKENRLQCIQCIKQGVHISHPQNQEDFNQLIDYFNNNEQSCMALIHNLNEQMGLARDQFKLLIEGIKKKYQISYNRVKSCNSIQLNSLFSDILQFKQFEQALLRKIQQSFQDFKDQLEVFYFDLKLYEFNSADPSNQERQKSDQLFEEGFTLYSKNNFNEAIKYFDKSINYYPRNQQSLRCKADSLRNLNKLDEAIIWVDKALQIDQNDKFSLLCKARCLSIIGQQNEAITLADKVLLLQFNLNLDALCTKSNSLRLLNMLPQAMDVIEKSLKINPKHFESLTVKGLCLQDQKQYQEALKYYEKALEIDSNHQLTKDRKAQCLAALNNT
ncbi:unnamed protein product [Paramecium octaurelia]|uniref:Tetratricopeptide repeat protein n=1 Tax=Paramecium octaurelia TaxID=43137 RepID=A0A8S1UUN9_PAROT|nr:unnamed protein product [Paramecium octaurelia]